MLTFQTSFVIVKATVMHNISIAIAVVNTFLLQLQEGAGQGASKTFNSATKRPINMISLF